MGPMGVPIGQWGPIFAPTGYVAHWCVIVHCVGIMAAHGVSLGWFLPPSIPPHPAAHPTHSLYYHY